MVCEAFHCTPDVAERQDYQLVTAILDVRLLEAAKQQHNDDASKMTAPMVERWMEMIQICGVDNDG